MREVDLSHRVLPQHHEVFRCLGLLGRTVDTDLWCLVGGLMVLVTSRAAGREDSRAEVTKDGDVVVDLAAEPRMLAKVANVLRSLGYDLPADDDRGAGFARCTFVSGRAQVDVLAADDAAPEQLDVEGGLRSLAIPGGRRALRGAELVTITYAEEAPDVVIRVPSLATALCVKAAAALDPRTAGHPRHLDDVAHLLSCVDDPVVLAEELDDEDRALLHALRAQRLGTAGPDGWQGLAPADRQRAQAAVDFLISD